MIDGPCIAEYGALNLALGEDFVLFNMGSAEIFLYSVEISQEVRF